MLSYETKITLAEILLSFAEHEQQIEVVRQILCEQDAFEPYAAFRRIDRARKGFITYDDILDFLKDNSVQHQASYCEALVKKYSKKNPTRLDYIDFLNIVLTQDNSDLRAATAQRPNYVVREGEFLPVDVEYSLSKVFDRELILLAKEDDLKYTLASRFDFNTRDAFATIDQARTNRINFDSLLSFFQEVSLSPHEEDVIGCLRRIDKDGDGVLSYEEFSEGLTILDERLLKIVKSSPNIQAKSPIRQASPRRRLSFTNSNTGTHTPSRSPQRILETTTLTPGSRYSPSKKVDFSVPKKASPINKTPQSKLKKTASPLSRSSPQSKSPILDENNSINKRLKELNSKLKASGYSQENRIRTDFSPIRSTLNTSTKNTVTPKKKNTDNRQKSASRAVIPLGEMNLNDSSSSIKGYGSPFSRISLPSKAERTPSIVNIRSAQQSPARKQLNNRRNSNSKIGLESTSPIAKDPFKQRSPSVLDEPRKNYPQVQIDDKDNQSLIHIMKQFILMEKELETSKQDLALRPDFNLLDFFRMFDLEGKGTLTSSEFHKGLKQFGVNARDTEVYLFMRRFDRDNDGKLKFSEFSEAICPKQSEYSIVLNNRTPLNYDHSLNINKLFSAETHRNIVRVLRLHLDNELSSETFKIKLQKNKNFNMHQAFNSVDQNRDGFITLDELRKFFEEQDAFVTDKELKLLLSRLDLNKDAKITYSEFVQEFTPKNDHR